MDIIERVMDPITWVSPTVISPKPGKDDVRICIHMILREKLPIPSMDEVLEEMNECGVLQT